MNDKITCSRCRFYSGDSECEKGELGDNGTADELFYCREYIYVAPFQVRDNSMGYVSEGESWYSAEDYPGWFDKILELECEIDKLLIEHPGAYFYPFQLKEKFSLFTFYYSCSASIAKEVDELVESMINWSATHCFTCGEPATYRSKGWVINYCGDCASKITERQNLRNGTDFALEGKFSKIKN